MFQGEEHEIAVRCIQGTYTWLSFVKAQSVRKEVTLMVMCGRPIRVEEEVFERKHYFVMKSKVGHR